MPRYNIQYKDVLRVYYWKTAYSGCFSDQILSLIAKADGVNKERFRPCFPEYVYAYEAWYNSEDPVEFFKSWGLNFWDSSND